MLCKHAHTLSLATLSHARTGSSTVTSWIRDFFSTPLTVYLITAAALQKAIALPCHQGAAISEAAADQAQPERLHATIVSTAPDTHSQHSNGSEEGPITQANPGVQLAATAAADIMPHGPLRAVTVHRSSSQQQPASSSSCPELLASVLAAVDPASGEHTT